MNLPLSKLSDGILGELAGAVIGWLLEQQGIAGLLAAVGLAILTAWRQLIKRRREVRKRTRNESETDLPRRILLESIARGPKKRIHFPRIPLWHVVGVVTAVALTALVVVFYPPNVEGNVTDKNGVACPNIKVLLYKSSEPEVWTAISNEDGVYQINWLQPGKYKWIAYRIRDDVIEWSDADLTVANRSIMLPVQDFPKFSKPATTAGPFLFAKDLDTLTSENHKIINSDTNRLEAAGSRVIVEGHTCSLGTWFQNRRLSRKRALVVADKLIPAIEPHRVLIAPFSSHDKLVDKTGAELLRDKQRRAMVIVLP